jgi:hypothetical protein
MADLKVTIKGAAKVDQDIKERRDGSLLVKYISHMSGDVIITLVSLTHFEWRFVCSTADDARTSTNLSNEPELQHCRRNSEKHAMIQICFVKSLHTRPRLSHKLALFAVHKRSPSAT